MLLALQSSAQVAFPEVDGTLRNSDGLWLYGQPKSYTSNVDEHLRVLMNVHKQEKRNLLWTSSTDRTQAVCTAD